MGRSGTIHAGMVVLKEMFLPKKNKVPPSSKIEY